MPGTLGGYQGNEARKFTLALQIKGGRRSAIVSKDNARDAYADVLPKILAMRSEGLSPAVIAVKLNEEGELSRTGKPWNTTQVYRVLKLASE